MTMIEKAFKNSIFLLFFSPCCKDLKNKHQNKTHKLKNYLETR